MAKYTKQDITYLQIARAISQNSRCLSRHIGAIIVKNGKIISSGYNGPPLPLPDCSYRSDDGQILSGRFRRSSVCPRYRDNKDSHGKKIDMCWAVHAERAAILNAIDMGVSVRGGTLYCSCGPPCKECILELLHVGINKIVCYDAPFYTRGAEKLIKNLLSKNYIALILVPIEEVQE